MKFKMLLIVTIVILLSWVAYKLVVQYQIRSMFDKDDPFSDDKKMLVDSVKYDDKYAIFWFTYDSGTFGHSADFLSSNTKKEFVSKNNSFFSSNSISSINIINDTLLIKLIELEYHFDSLKFGFPIKIELENQGVYISPSKRLNIPIK